jgi:SpoVK/Ycf46/Vps4 family AAA+-type ATPase
MYGPPGTGKTMLAKAFSELLPKLSFEETSRGYRHTLGRWNFKGGLDQFTACP